MACEVGCQFQKAYEDGSTNFTCDQLIDYCKAYQTWLVTEKRIGKTVNVGLLVGGLGGLISYIMMVIVFRLPDFKGASYIYHKSIVYMEIAHMFVMAQSGLERFLPIDKTSYSYIFYIKVIRELWLLGDAMKLSTSMVTAFLSMERFVAIWLPKKFARFNQPKVAWTFVLISFLFSLLSFSPAFTEKLEQRVVDNVTMWVSAAAQSNVGGNEVVTFIIYGAKGVTSVVMVVCCIGVAAGLVVVSKKAATMSSTAGAMWKENRRLSVLQIIIALLQIMDHAMWVVSNVIFDQQQSVVYLGLEAITRLDYEEAMNTVRRKAFWRWTFASQEVTGILDHAARLPLYLIGMKKFRRGFLALFRKNAGSLVSQKSGSQKAPSYGHPQKLNAVAPRHHSE